jgi:hypothetical protein
MNLRLSGQVQCLRSASAVLWRRRRREEGTAAPARKHRAGGFLSPPARLRPPLHLIRRATCRHRSRWRSGSVSTTGEDRPTNSWLRWRSTFRHELVCRKPTRRPPDLCVDASGSRCSSALGTGAQPSRGMLRGAVFVDPTAKAYIFHLARLTVVRKVTQRSRVRSEEILSVAL